MFLMFFLLTEKSQLNEISTYIFTNFKKTEIPVSFVKCCMLQFICLAYCTKKQ